MDTHLFALPPPFVPGYSRSYRMPNARHDRLGRERVSCRARRNVATYRPNNILFPAGVFPKSKLNFSFLCGSTEPTLNFVQSHVYCIPAPLYGAHSRLQYLLQCSTTKLLHSLQSLLFWRDDDELYFLTCYFSSLRKLWSRAAVVFA